VARSKYTTRDGGRINPKRIHIYANALKKIERSGPLTAERVVEIASNSIHPLHECFEWDDDKAANAYRLWQARNLIASVLIEISDTEDEEPPRAFLNVVTSQGREYVSVERAMSDAELRTQVIQEAAGRLAYWRKAYKQFKELAEIFGAAERKARKIAK